MKQQFVETIKIKEGQAQAIAYHQERMERTIRHFFPSLGFASMPSLERLLAPKAHMDLYKARVVYGEPGVESIEYAPYSMREVHSLQVVEDDNITYNFKSTNRDCLNALAARKGGCDEIIIVKRGLVRDTSYTNVALYDGKLWLTPRQPLLLGTKRAYLLEKKLIQEADLTLDDLRKAQKVSLFNAMIELEEREVTIAHVHF